MSSDKKDSDTKGINRCDFIMAGAAGIKPYQPRDDRVEGPEKGLLSGPDGESIIYRKVDEPETGSEAGKRPDETAECEEQKMGSEEKEAEIKN